MKKARSKSAQAQPGNAVPVARRQELKSETREYVEEIFKGEPDPAKAVAEVLDARFAVENSGYDSYNSPQERVEAEVSAEHMAEELDAQLSKPELNEVQRHLLISIRKRMADLRLSQAELARTTGINPSVLNRLLKGHRGVSTYQLERLCHGLGLDAHDLIMYAQPPADPVINIKLKNVELEAKNSNLERSVDLFVSEIREHIRNLKRKAEAAMAGNRHEELPKALREFLTANYRRLTPEEEDMLVTAARTMPPDQGSTELWLDLIRNHRRTARWPPPKA